MINCKNSREYICAYIDDELSIKERLSFDEHVKNCSECKRELDEMIGITDLCKELPQHELPADFKSELHEKLVAVADRQENKVISIKKPKGFLFLKTFASIAAALLLVLLAGSFYKFGLFSPVKMQNSANGTALTMGMPEAAKDEAMADADGSTSKIEMGSGSAAQAKVFSTTTAEAAAPVAPKAAAPAEALAGAAEIARSATAQDRDTAAYGLTAGSEKVNSKLSTITVSADDLNMLTGKIKALAVANNADIVDNKVIVTFSESRTMSKQANADQSVATADNAGGPVPQQLVLSIPDTQYEQFVSALDNEFGAANVLIGAFVTEDMTNSLNSAIAESNEADNRIQELQNADGTKAAESTKNAPEIEALKARKEAADKRIDELRLGSDFVNVTIIMNAK